jgi:hypothetical protein
MYLTTPWRLRLPRAQRGSCYRRQHGDAEQQRCIPADPRPTRYGCSVTRARVTRPKSPTLARKRGKSYRKTRPARAPGAAQRAVAARGHACRVPTQFEACPPIDFSRRASAALSTCGIMRISAVYGEHVRVRDPRVGLVRRARARSATLQLRLQPPKRVSLCCHGESFSSSSFPVRT